MSLSALIGPAGSTVSYDIKELSPAVESQVDDRDTCTIVIIDPNGTAVFTPYQTIAVEDSILGTLFTGIIQFAKMTPYYPSDYNEWSLTNTDQMYRLDKRESNWTYAGQYSGTIVVDQIQRFAPGEHVSAAAALQWSELETDWAAGTRSNTAAATNASNGNPGGGDLELALAGSQYTYSGSVTSSTWNAIAFTAYASSGYTAPICIRQIWTGSQALVTNDTFSYNVWVASDSPAIIASCDFVCSDGTTLSSTVAVDTLGLSAKATTDLSGLANDQWFTRAFLIPSALNGKTLKSVNLVLAGTTSGTYRAWFSDIFYVVASGPTIVDIFGPTDTLTTNNQLSRVGYTNISAGQVTALDSARQQPITTIGSVSAPGIVKDSQIAWDATIPADCSIVVETSIDGQASWQTATNGSPIPNLLAGMEASNLDLNYRVTLQLGKDPTQTSIGLTLLTMLINPSYAATKSDVTKAYASSNAPAATAFNAAGTTLTNTTLDGFGNLELNGFQNDWSDGSTTGQTFFSSSTGSQSAATQRLTLTAAASNDARARMDVAGNQQNFTAEVDITIPAAGSSIGLNYRETNWQNAINSFAYSIEVSTTSFRFGHGNNSSSGSGAFTALNTVTVSLVAASVHRLKAVISGNSHIFFLDGIQLISQSDSTYTATGEIALRFFNGGASTATATFDNFGVVAALSGTWQSAAISISSATTYGTSMVEWDIDGIPDATCSITVQTSVDGGSTFQSVTNGGAISGLTAGQSLATKTVILKVTLSATNAPIVPILNGISVWVLGQYSSSGTWVSPSLSLANVGRAANSLVNWNALLPTHTTLVVATSLNGGSTYSTVSAAGNAVPGITLAPAPTVDTFASNTSANYTSTHGTSGSSATLTWDTANSRLKLVGGSKAALLVNGLSVTDVYLFVDLYQSENAGMVWRWVDASNYYELIVTDSADSSPNTMTLNKYVSGTLTQLATGSISFPTQTHHYAQVSMLGTAIVCSFDGVQILSHTDSSLSSGSVGVRNDTGTSYIYDLYIQPQGEDVTALSVLTRLTLSSTDPTATPQVTDLQTFVSSAAIGAGTLIPKASYNSSNSYVSSDIEDLKTQSNYWTDIADVADSNGNYDLTFQARTARPAPWPLDANNYQIVDSQQINDILWAGPPTITEEAPLYRNRQVIKGAIATTTFSQSFVGDGSATSWQVANPIVAPPTIWTLNGQPVTFGVLNVDSGRDFYYEPYSTALTQDGTGTVLQKADVLFIQYSGSSTQDVIVDNTSIAGTITQSALAAITGDSGIVTNIVDVSSENMTVAAATTYATQLLTRYGVIGISWQYTTLRPGLAAGMQQAMYVPRMLLSDVPMLLTDVKMTEQLSPVANGGILWAWQVTAMTGPALGSWTKLLASGLSS